MNKTTLSCVTLVVSLVVGTDGLRAAPIRAVACPTAKSCTVTAEIPGFGPLTLDLSGGGVGVIGQDLVLVWDANPSPTPWKMSGKHPELGTINVTLDRERRSLGTFEGKELPTKMTNSFFFVVAVENLGTFTSQEPLLLAGDVASIPPIATLVQEKPVDFLDAKGTRVILRDAKVQVRPALLDIACVPPKFTLPAQGGIDRLEVEANVGVDIFGFGEDTINMRGRLVIERGAPTSTDWETGLFKAEVLELRAAGISDRFGVVRASLGPGQAFPELRLPCPGVCPLPCFLCPRPCVDLVPHLELDFLDPEVGPLIINDPIPIELEVTRVPMAGASGGFAGGKVPIQNKAGVDVGALTSLKLHVLSEVGLPPPDHTLPATAGVDTLEVEGQLGVQVFGFKPETLNLKGSLVIQRGAPTSTDWETGTFKAEVLRLDVTGESATFGRARASLGAGEAFPNLRIPLPCLFPPCPRPCEDPFPHLEIVFERPGIPPLIINERIPFSLNTNRVPIVGATGGVSDVQIPIVAKDGGGAPLGVLTSLQLLVVRDVSGNSPQFTLPPVGGTDHLQVEGDVTVDIPGVAKETIALRGGIVLERGNPKGTDWETGLFDAQLLNLTAQGRSATLGAVQVILGPGEAFPELRLPPCPQCAPLPCRFCPRPCIDIFPHVRIIVEPDPEPWIINEQIRVELAVTRVPVVGASGGLVTEAPIPILREANGATVGFLTGLNLRVLRDTGGLPAEYIMPSAAAVDRLEVGAKISVDIPGITTETINLRGELLLARGAPDVVDWERGRVKTEVRGLDVRGRSAKLGAVRATIDPGIAFPEVLLPDLNWPFGPLCPRPCIDPIPHVIIDFLDPVIPEFSVDDIIPLSFEVTRIPVVGAVAGLRGIEIPILSRAGIGGGGQGDPVGNLTGIELVILDEVPETTTPPPIFRRGDSDDSGTVALTDAIVILSCLFLGTPCPPCSDAMDADDNGSVSLTDSIVILSYLFLGTPPPPPPGPINCGLDPTPDGLVCTTYTSC